MCKGSTFLPALALTALLAMPVSAETEPNANTVVARVNGEEITLGHMIVAHSNLPDQYQQLPASVLYDAILDQLIQQVALQQSQDGAASKYVELSLENERRALMASEAIQDVIAGAASDEEIRSTYDERYSDGFGGDEFNASHILVETEEEALAIRAELEAGADFADTAREKSTGPSGPNGGSLGWFTTGRMVPEFENAVLALSAGELSQPVQTQFGWHVIKLNEKRKTAAPEFDAVREEIAGELRDKAVETRIEALTKSAEIERPVVEGLEPEVLRDVGLIRN